MSWDWESRVAPAGIVQLWFTPAERRALKEVVDGRIERLEKCGSAGLMPTSIVELEVGHLRPIAERLALLQEVE